MLPLDQTPNQSSHMTGLNTKPKLRLNTKPNLTTRLKHKVQLVAVSCTSRQERQLNLYTLFNAEHA